MIGPGHLSVIASLALTAMAVEFPELVVPEGLEYLGCHHAKNAGVTTLGYNASSTDDMTIEGCSSTCSVHGYRYSGTLAGVGCFCDADFTSSLTPTHLCNVSCTGNATEICGARDLFSIVKDPTVRPGAGTTPSEYNIVGCFPADLARSWALFYLRSDNDTSLTQATCKDMCSQDEYSVAGVQNGTQCWCGSSGTGGLPARQNDDLCSIPCPGALDDGDGTTAPRCGGENMMSVFSTHLYGLEDEFIPSTTVTSTSTVEATSTSTARPKQDQSNGGATVAASMQQVLWTAAGIFFVSALAY